MSSGQSKSERLGNAFSRRRSVDHGANQRNNQQQVEKPKNNLTNNKIQVYTEPESMRSTTTVLGMEPAVIPSRSSARTRDNMLADARRMNQRHPQQRRSHPQQNNNYNNNAHNNHYNTQHNNRPPRSNQRNNRGPPDRRISTGRTWVPVCPPDDGCPEEGEFNGTPIIRIMHEMTNPTGSATREGAIYVEKPPSQQRNQFTLTYRYVKPDLSTGEGIYNMDLQGDLPPGIRIRTHIEGQSMLAESLAKNSPDYRYKDIFDQKIATPSEPSVINGWSGWWTQDQFFVDLYANDPQKFPKLYVPDSPIFPREIRGGLWQNTVMLNCNVSCLDHVFEMLELSVSKNLFIKIWYYRSSEETKRLETWTNMGDIEAPIFPNDSDVVVYCLQCETNYVLLLIWWFASATMSKTEPARHFNKNREFASLMIHCRVNEYETEWMPFAGSKTIAEITYHMLAYAFKLYEAVPEMITIQEQPKIKIIGLISLSQLMNEASAVMNRQVIDPLRDSNYENYYENYISHSIAYDANFQPVKKASGRHCATWELVTNPRKNSHAKEPETMLMTIIRVYNEAKAAWHHGGIGYDHASSREVLAHKLKIFEREVKKHVDIQSSPEYQEQVEKNKDLANVAKLNQLKILQSDEAQKALKLTELQASMNVMNEEKNEMARKIVEMENKNKLEKQTLEEILKKKDEEGKLEREALTAQINALRTLVETYQANVERDDMEIAEEPSSSASIATRSNGRGKLPTRPNKRTQQDNGGTGASSLFTTTQTTKKSKPDLK
ncbi:unnamed protein product [Oikopleura dioica]|uniref:Uncharacterized protein n=1 Tax=Oikopleura dioica TaxID=34765 RepID=E4Y676_OIKDI|nr:unnamed protein product [Oikopleura dioica]